MTADFKGMLPIASLAMELERLTPLWKGKEVFWVIWDFESIVNTRRYHRQNWWQGSLCGSAS